MNILVIDYCSLWGHRNFNKIHIESILGLGHQCHFVGRKEAFSTIDGISSDDITSIPQRLDTRDTKHFFIKRLKEILTLLWVKRNFNTKNYDLILFLTYDVISLFFFRVKQNVVIINHDNAAKLESKIYLEFTRRLPSNYCHVVLAEDIKPYLTGILRRRQIYYVPHGFLKHYNAGIRPSFLKGNANFLFCPVNSGYDIDFVSKVFNSSAFADFLKKNGLLFVAKKNLINDQSEQYVCLNGMISDEEYCYLISNAKAVVLPYSRDYKYRSSGILFECVATGTPVISNKIDSMLIYKDKMNISYYFDLNSLISCINSIQHSKCYDYSGFNVDSYWNELLTSFKTK